MQPPSMSEENGVLVVQFDDPRVLNELPSLWSREEIYRVIQVRECPRVLIDLGTIDYLSSLGIGVFVGLKRRVEAEGGKIVFVGIHPYVKDVLETMSLAKVLTIAPDREAAFSLLGEGAAS